jgi:hypothetical protein
VGAGPLEACSPATGCRRNGGLAVRRWDQLQIGSAGLESANPYTASPVV